MLTHLDHRLDHSDVNATAECVSGKINGLPSPTPENVCFQTETQYGDG